MSYAIQALFQWANLKVEPDLLKTMNNDELNLFGQKLRHWSDEVEAETLRRNVEASTPEG